MQIRLLLGTLGMRNVESDYAGSFTAAWQCKRRTVRHSWLEVAATGEEIMERLVQVPVNSGQKSASSVLRLKTTQWFL